MVRKCCNDICCCFLLVEYFTDCQQLSKSSSALCCTVHILAISTNDNNIQNEHQNASIPTRFFVSVSRVLSNFSVFKQIADSLSCTNSDFSENDIDVPNFQDASEVSQQQLDRRVRSSPIARYIYNDDRFI